MLAGSLAALAVPAVSAAENSKRNNAQAVAQLQRMSASLASAKAFSYKSINSHEVPAKTGQFVTVFATANVAVQRPNKLRVRLGGEAPPFDLYYDGTTVSALAPRTGVYSTAKAPGTLDEMLAGLETETGIRYASAPFLFSDPAKVLERKLTSAVLVGRVAVRGVPCFHLAFQSPGVNWELWIESGSRALPLRLAATFTDRPNAPRTMVEFSDWNLHPWLTSGSFTFRAPTGAKETPFISALKAENR